METKLLDKELALKHFKFVFSHDLSPVDMKREAAISMAEWYEEKADFKNAHEMYTHATKICESKASCNYAYYKRAWLLYKETRLEEAISDLKRSLWDKDGRVRHQSLDDYVLFLSNRISDGVSEYKEIEAISKKTKQFDLTQRLSAAYYAAGNRFAASFILSEINKQSPKAYYEVRLLEENYGFRKWDEVAHYISALEKRKVSDLPKKKETAKEVNSILKRFIVQLDAESVKNKDVNLYLKRSIDVFMNFYPEDSMYQKMQQGWLKVETDNFAKIKRLEEWISKESLETENHDYIRKLRQTRLALAQKESMLKIVAFESQAIADALSNEKEKREYEYISSHASYKLKDYKRSLGIFKKLAAPFVDNTTDKWSVLAQNLVLDIYNINKNYDGIIEQVALWDGVQAISNKKPKFEKELNSMKLIREQAMFEKAVSLKQTPEALAQFHQFCFAKVFEKKSCENAKILAIQLKDQGKLVSLLEREGDEAALVNEYERMGEFSKAARIHEKNLSYKSEIPKFLKIAILYEIDQDLKARDKVLKKMITKIKRKRKIDPKFEGVIFLTLDEAQMIDDSALSIPWSLNRKLALANRLETENPATKTKKILLSPKVIFW